MEEAKRQVNEWIRISKKYKIYTHFLCLSTLKLRELPKHLPNKLEEIWIRKNKLTELPKLPKNLKILYCSQNELTSLPKLPSHLRKLDCEFNELTSLPKLPKKLETLDCRLNYITKIPNLPASLKELRCEYNPFLYNRINIITRFPNIDIFTNKNDNYAFSNYRIVLKLQRKQRNKTKNKMSKLMYLNKVLHNNLISDILKFY